MRYLLCILVFLSVVSCGGDDPASASSVTIGGQNSTNLNVFYSSMKSIEVEVLYEEGAVPYDGVTNKGFPLWQITEDNLKAVFENRGQQVDYTVPIDRDQMTKIPDQEKQSWSESELLALEAAHRKSNNTGESASFFVIFVNGHYSENGEVKKGVIGVSLGGTTVVAIFKDVIVLEEDNSSVAVAKFMEQTTIIHELGHALGLVNNGVALKSQHEDQNHKAHCTNEQCVMYWKNAGRVDLVKFILQILQDEDNVIFRSFCLEDSKAYKP